MGRTIVSVIAGILVALAAIWATDMVNHLLHPLPPRLNIYDRSALGAYMKALPPLALFLVGFAWFLGALTGGLVAATLSQRPAVAWVVAGLVVLAGLANVAMFAHPLVLQVAAVAAPLLGGWLAAILARRRPAPAAVEAAP
jgi:hypothetical protein